MARVTLLSARLRSYRGVRSLEVAAVSRDPAIRSELARAFDAAPPTWHVTLYETPPADADIVVLGPDVPGDGITFDPAQPARLLDEISARTATSNLIAVTSAGGGTGLTSVVLHLAKAAAAGSRTCCLEAAPGGMALRLGLPDAAPTWADVLDPESALEPAALPVPGGYRVLVAPTEAGRDVHGVVERAISIFDVVVAEVSAPGASLIQQARCAVLVVPPTIPGAARARALLDAYPATRWGIVTNRLGPGGETTRAALECILDRKIAIELPTCAALRDAEDTGRLLSSPLYGWWRRIQRLWRALDRT